MAKLFLKFCRSFVDLKLLSVKCLHFAHHVVTCISQILDKHQNSKIGLTLFRFKTDPRYFFLYFKIKYHVVHKSGGCTFSNCPQMIVAFGSTQSAYSQSYLTTTGFLTRLHPRFYVSNPRHRYFHFSSQRGSYHHQNKESEIHE